ncbi:MAG TPA: hypothetical protein PKD52_04650 [Clostridiales bacterium]|nr:hypothetical protein [Clostridiales bacterium]
MENRVRFKIGEIEFEAEGSAEIVEHERSVFLNTLLPAAVDAIVRTRGMGKAAPYIEAIDRPAMLLSAEIDDSPENNTLVNHPLIDFARTSLYSYIKNLGILSDQDFTLIAAYYDEKKNGVQSFTSETVKQYYADARRGKSSNYSDLLQRLTQKGYIMDDPKAEKKIPKPYILTDAGIKYVEAYQPKENGSEKPKGTKAKKPRSKQVSVYSILCADDLNLKKYPEIKSQSTFKKQMLLTLYIVTTEGKGESFLVTDIQCLMTDILGLPASVDQINGIFKNNKSWFKTEQDSTNKKAYKRKLLQGAKDFVQTIIDGTAD